MIARRLIPLVSLLSLAALSAGCAGSASTSTRPQQPQQPPPYYGQYPGYPPPYGQYPQQPGYPPPGYPPQQPQQPQQPPPPAQRPLLAPLIGVAAWQAEVRSVLAELIAALPPQQQSKVRGIPVAFEPNPFEINAFAGCDDTGTPFMAGTQGILEAFDAVAQTRATDELFNTRTYDAYSQSVLPRLVQSDKASAALPPGIIPAQFLADPRRLSRAHELFDDLTAFTFGHELAHHYLGHTGCANGQAMGGGPNAARLGHILTTIAPGLNQFNEVAADNAGALNTLDAGRARLPNYRWSEKGGFMLFDFFTRMEQVAGVSPLHPIGFLRTHPHPAIRTPVLNAATRQWYSQHPEVRQGT